MPKRACVVVATVVFATTAAAQGSKVQFGFGAGRAIPTGDYHATGSGEGFNAAWTGMAFVAVKVSPRLSLRLDGTSGGHSANDVLKGNLTTALDTPTDATTKLVGASVDLTYSLAAGARPRPYVLGGLGMYHVTIAVTSADSSTDNGETNFAWNVGAGLEYRVSRTTLFVEGRYVNAGAVSGFPGTTVFPIIAGVRFGAP